MKAVMISIRPKWVEKIASGEKTIEVRKTAPKLEVPFKCYIYCTKPRGPYYVAGGTAIYDDDLWKNDKGKIEFNDMWYYTGSGVLHECFYLNGKVVSEFVCDEILPIEVLDTGAVRNYHYYHLEETDLSIEDIEKYIGKNKVGYGWHISDLKIYDKPKELSEFYQQSNAGYDLCDGCVHHECPITEYPCNFCDGRRKYLYCPPQSWCYVEAEG